MSSILDSLNPKQKQAAQHIDGALLILAGAGSGKTKTLTSRLAYLIKEVGVAPDSTLTLTFTNKAASEMRERALNLLHQSDDFSFSHFRSLPPPLLCTFHRFGLLFLRMNISRLERSPNFTLIDNDDQKRIIKQIDSSIQSAMILGYISNQKNALISARNASLSAQTPQQKIFSKIYEKYEAFLLKNNMVDFDDLLLLSFRILDNDENLCMQTSQKYQYIMVDEYQDTNLLQVALLKKLCHTHQNICVVGDDDQSIYSWRGADIGYILGFAQSFDNAKVIKLESNYRSKAPILNAANALIAYNTSRLGKELKSTRGDGDKVEHIYSYDENEESNTIAKKISNLILEGAKPQEIAILFRLNALSRSIEEGLNRAKIPYKLIGAIRFYERAEIKDILAYFRLVVNIDDDFSLRRVINTPKRGIGEVVQQKIFSKAQSLGTSVAQSYKAGHLDSILKPAQKRELEAFFGILLELQNALEESPLKFVNDFSEKIKVIDEVKNKHDEIDRLANVNEFYGYFRDYIMQNPHNSLNDFLSDLSLSSGLDVPLQDCVCLMSVHSAKGLEFEYVFVVGMEKGFFPLMRDESDLEEERRLGYVAFTRAKDRLFLSSVRSRFYKGRREFMDLSPFLYEAKILQKNRASDSSDFDDESNDEITLKSSGEKKIYSIKSNHTQEGFKKGDAIRHKIFGAGVIKEVQGDKLHINFGGSMRVIMKDFVEKV
ncbi:ATP-dependent helicase [Helicobacter sp. T3_23-1059]